MNNQKILIVGGYGVVGGRIATQLAPDYPGRVVIAGRNLKSAEAAAALISHGVQGRWMDVTQTSTLGKALDGVSVVVNCIDQPKRTLLNEAIQRGLCYTDITPHLTELGRGIQYEKIRQNARSSGAKVVLGTGIVPGISNVMVRALVEQLGGADEIETALQLSAKDVTGPASFDYFLQELSMSFNLWIQGKDQPSRAFSSPKPIQYPKSIGTRPSYLFPFSDQVLYPVTLGARTAITRLTIEPGWLSRVLAVLSGTRASQIFAIKGIRHFIANYFRNTGKKKSAHFALCVNVQHLGRSMRAVLFGGAQADAAAAGAAEVARLLIEGKISVPDAYMPEQIVIPGPFFSRLAALGLTVEIQSIHS